MTEVGSRLVILQPGCHFSLLNKRSNRSTSYSKDQVKVLNDDDTFSGMIIFCLPKGRKAQKPIQLNLMFPVFHATTTR